VTESNLDNFWILVLICNVSTILPLVFIGWIPPDGEDYGEDIVVSRHAREEKQRA
jgi:hypothetical protein